MMVQYHSVTLFLQFQPTQLLSPALISLLTQSHRLFWIATRIFDSATPKLGGVLPHFRSILNGCGMTSGRPHGVSSSAENSCGWAVYTTEQWHVQLFTDTAGPTVKICTYGCARFWRSTTREGNTPFLSFVFSVSGSSPISILHLRFLCHSSLPTSSTHYPTSLHNNLYLPVLHYHFCLPSSVGDSSPTYYS